MRADQTSDIFVRVWHPDGPKGGDPKGETLRGGVDEGTAADAAADGEEAMVSQALLAVQLSHALVVRLKVAQNGLVTLNARGFRTDHRPEAREAALALWRRVVARSTAIARASDVWHVPRPEEQLVGESLSLLLGQSDVRPDPPPADAAFVKPDVASCADGGVSGAASLVPSDTTPKTIESAGGRSSSKATFALAAPLAWLAPLDEVEGKHDEEGEDVGDIEDSK
jgi:hypothetical protein